MLICLLYLYMENRDAVYGNWANSAFPRNLIERSFIQAQIDQYFKWKLVETRRMFSNQLYATNIILFLDTISQDICDIKTLIVCSSRNRLFEWLFCGDEKYRRNEIYMPAAKDAQARSEILRKYRLSEDQISHYCSVNLTLR